MFPVPKLRCRGQVKANESRQAQEVDVASSDEREGERALTSI